MTVAVFFAGLLLLATPISAAPGDCTVEEYAAYREVASSDSVHSSERQQRDTISSARNRVSAECEACIFAQDPAVTDASGIADEDIWDECTGFMDPSYGPGLQGSIDHFDAGFWKELVYYVYGNGNHFGCIRESTIAGCASAKPLDGYDQDFQGIVGACQWDDSRRDGYKCFLNEEPFAELAAQVTVDEALQDLERVASVMQSALGVPQPGDCTPKDYAAFRQATRSSYTAEDSAINRARELASFECHVCIVTEDPSVTSNVEDGVADEDIYSECVRLLDEDSPASGFYDADWWEAYMYYISGNGDRDGCISAFRQSQCEGDDWRMMPFEGYDQDFNGITGACQWDDSQPEGRKCMLKQGMFAVLAASVPAADIQAGDNSWIASTLQPFLSGVAPEKTSGSSIFVPSHATMYACPLAVLMMRLLY